MAQSNKRCTCSVKHRIPLGSTSYPLPSLTPYPVHGRKARFLPSVADGERTQDPEAEKRRDE